MFYRLSLLVLFVFAQIGVEAQNQYTQNFSTQSANAFAFDKIDNVPMNNFTGMATINLPLYEKKMSVLNFNMSLNYTGGGGLKANEYAPIAGKGWLLRTGGMITRYTRGIPDDYQTTQTLSDGTPIVGFNGVLYNNGVTYKPDGDTRISIADPTYSYANGPGDSQHDIFEFNIPGKSGKFYIGKDKQIIMVTDSKVKIIPDFTTSTLPEFKLGSFQIIDEAGIKYYFNQVEVTSEYYSNSCPPSYFYNKNYASSWLLTKIEAPFSEETITYQYISRQNWTGVASTGIYFKRSDVPNGQQSSSGGGGAKEVDIQSITFSDQSKINFNYFLDSTTDPTASSLLKSIDIINTQQEIVKTFNLNYLHWGSDKKSYYTNSMPALHTYFATKVFDYLNTVDLVSSTNKTQTIYAFDYFLDQNLNESAMPNGVDFWGYYNGKTNATSFLVATQWGPAADRSPDINYAKLGLIKKIIYPAGGSEEFDYELNDKRGTTTNITVAGVRVKKRTLHDGINSQNDIIKQYKYIETDGLSSGFLGEQPQYTYVQNTYLDDGGWPTNPHLKYTTTLSFTDPINPLSNVDGSFAGYRRVEELFQNGGNINGKVVYEYTDLSYATFWDPKDYYPYHPVDRPYWAVGLPLTTTYYSVAGQITKQTVKEYNLFQQQKVDDNYRSLYISSDGEIDVDLANGSPDPNAMRYIYKYRNYYPVIGRAELKATHEYNYSSDGSNTTTQQLTQNTYDPNYFFPRTSSQLNSDGNTVTKYYYYPFDYNLGASSFTNKLTTNNSLNQPVLIEAWLIKTSGGKYLIGSNVTDYQMLSNNIIRPSTMYSAHLAQPLAGTPGGFSGSVLLPADHNFMPEIIFNTYDAYSRLVEYENPGGIKTAIVLDKSGNTLAKADNASFNNIAYTGFETDDLGNWTYPAAGISSASSKSGSKSFTGSMTKNGLTLGNYVVNLWAKGTGSVTVNGVPKSITNAWGFYKWMLSGITAVSIVTNGNLVDQVALYPQNAQMATVNFRKGIEIESTTDISDKVKYFEYDEFARLINIKDQGNNIIKNYSFNYKTPFLNVPQSGSFTRRTCPIGQNYVPGPPVTYTVPAGKYASIISQADADAQAVSDVYNWNGQAYADANGTCNVLYYNAVLSMPYTRNNCAAGTTPTQVYYLVPANTYSSSISQADADLQAQNDANSNGQNYANTNGACTIPVTVTLSNSTSDTFMVSFSGISTQYAFAPGSSSITIPSGNYTVNISPVSTSNTHSFYVGSRTAIVGASATFSAVSITTVAGSEKNFGVY